jgi:hypothetical protein
MAGGLMQLAATGQQSIILTGNPTKTFWKSTYAKYTNFGKQNFRLDYEGSPTLRLNEESTFVFKIKRHADLLMDCYASVTLPNIWSPIVPPIDKTNNNWSPYEFKWIENIGAQMISNITITCGNQTIQQYSGQYLMSLVNRDFTQEKKDLFNRMTGNIPELNNPSQTLLTHKNIIEYVDRYPNAYYTSELGGAQPSIDGRILYIPILSWFSLKSQMAFPLIAMQYNELNINITFRPIREMFIIRDVYNPTEGFPFIAPNFNQAQMQMYNFLQTPPDVSLNNYQDKRCVWSADINLNCTYCFLSDEEAKIFASKEHKYIFKQVQETKYYNVTGQSRINIDSFGSVANWMFYLQRSDIGVRNEWSNYTNWSYKYKPSDIMLVGGRYDVTNNNKILIGTNLDIDPFGSEVQNKFPYGSYITGTYKPENIKDILVNIGILVDGEYRENTMNAGILNYVEKFARTNGGAPDGVFCYNFCLNTSPYDLQPSGAMDMSKYGIIQFEVQTIAPPLDANAQTMTICDPDTGEIIGINKPTWRIYKYNYDMTLFEERINILSFMGGNAALMYAT